MDAEKVLTANGSQALDQNVQKHCQQLHKLLKEAHEKSNIEVVETCFQCWHDMYYFGGTAGTTDQPLCCISTKLLKHRLTVYRIDHWVLQAHLQLYSPCNSWLFLRACV